MLNQNTQNVKTVSVSALTWDTFQRLGLVMSGDRFASLAYPTEEAEGLAHIAYCANIGAESKSAAWSRFVELCTTSTYTQIPAEVKAALSSKSFRNIATDETYTIAQMVEAYEADYLPTIEEGDEPMKFRVWLREIVESGDFEEVPNEAEEEAEGFTIERDSEEDETAATAEEAAQVVVDWLSDSEEGEEAYRDTIDEVYPMVEIMGMTYYPSVALERLDPVAYRCGLADWADSIYSDIVYELEHCGEWGGYSFTIKAASI